MFYVVEISLHHHIRTLSHGHSFNGVCHVVLVSVFDHLIFNVACAINFPDMKCMHK